MNILNIDCKGRAILSEHVMKHLGIEHGGNIELDLLPEGEAILKTVQPRGTIDAFLGLLANQTTKVASLEEIEEASAAGWAGEP